MYTSFFGLRSDPFGMTPDPAYLLLTPCHLEAFAGLTYVILNRRGFGVLTGDAGTGKSTLVAKVLASLPKERVRSSIVFHPTLTTNDFLEMVLLDFGISDIPQSKAQRLTRLREFLLDNHRNNRISTLIIDEAHKLSGRLLEEIRLLGNFENSDHKLLQILLVGQTELDEILNRENLRQLKQRVAVRLTIEALAPEQVPEYIACRWAKAGGVGAAPFSAPAVQEIARASRGLPRNINALCDNALLLAFAEESHSVEFRHVHETAIDLNMCAPPSASLAAIKTEAQQMDMKTRAQKVEQPPPAAVIPVPPGPVRIPDFCVAPAKSFFLARWAEKLRMS